VLSISIKWSCTCLFPTKKKIPIVIHLFILFFTFISTKKMTQSRKTGLTLGYLGAGYDLTPVALAYCRGWDPLLRIQSQFVKMMGTDSGLTIIKLAQRVNTVVYFDNNARRSLTMTEWIGHMKHSLQYDAMWNYAYMINNHTTKRVSFVDAMGKEFQYLYDTDILNPSPHAAAKAGVVDVVWIHGFWCEGEDAIAKQLELFVGATWAIHDRVDSGDIALLKKYLPHATLIPCAYPTPDAYTFCSGFHLLSQDPRDQKIMDDVSASMEQP
jgi:hypothetical protein